MSEDLAKFLNMVLSGLGLIALIFVIVKIFKLDRFVPPIIPGVLGGVPEKTHEDQVQAIQPQPQTSQEPIAVSQPQNTYGSYYYTDLYENLPNVPQIPEPSTSHNKAGNKVQVEDLPMVTSEYNQAPVVEKESEVEPFFDEAVTEIHPIQKPVPMVIAPRRNTKNSESWSIQRDEEGNLIGISVDRDVKEYSDE